MRLAALAELPRAAGHGGREQSTGLSSGSEERCSSELPCTHTARPQHIRSSHPRASAWESAGGSTPTLNRRGISYFLWDLSREV